MICCYGGNANSHTTTWHPFPCQHCVPYDVLPLHTRGLPEADRLLRGRDVVAATTTAGLCRGFRNIAFLDDYPFTRVDRC